MKVITHILFATDFSEASGDAFAYARELAQVLHAKLTVLHVVSFPMDLRDFYVPHISFEEIDQEIEEQARKKMAVFSATWQSLVPDMATAVVTGQASEEIVKKALEDKVDMIVMGTHGRRGFDHFIFGSTAEKVVKGAPCPVLTVRPIVSHLS